MNALERQGWRITLAIALFSIVPALLIVALAVVAGYGARISASIWLGLVIQIAIAWMLLRGSERIRGMLIFVNALSGLLAVAQLFVPGTPLSGGHLVALSLRAATQLTIAVILVRSESVHAYFNRENRPATLDLTIPQA